MAQIVLHIYPTGNEWTLDANTIAACREYRTIIAQRKKYLIDLDEQKAADRLVVPEDELRRAIVYLFSVACQCMSQHHTRVMETPDEVRALISAANLAHDACVTAARNAAISAINEIHAAVFPASPEEQALYVNALADIERTYTQALSAGTACAGDVTCTTATESFTQRVDKYEEDVAHLPAPLSMVYRTDYWGGYASFMTFPTGTLEGDLAVIVNHVYNQTGNAAAVAVPDGWNLAMSGSSADLRYAVQMVYKVLTAQDIVTNRVPLSVGQTTANGCMIFRPSRAIKAVVIADSGFGVAGPNTEPPAFTLDAPVASTSSVAMPVLSTFCAGEAYPYTVTEPNIFNNSTPTSEYAWDYYYHGRYDNAEFDIVVINNRVAMSFSVRNSGEDGILSALPNGNASLGACLVVS
ncbi:hypothetical protein ACQZ5N_01030 [Agrobacterium sp. 22-221-1]